jgi:hypothetical protein
LKNSSRNLEHFLLGPLEIWETNGRVKKNVNGEKINNIRLLRAVAVPKNGLDTITQKNSFWNLRQMN